MDSKPTFMQASTEEPQATSSSSKATKAASENRASEIVPLQSSAASESQSEDGSDWAAKINETTQQIAEEIVQLLSSYQQVLIYGAIFFLAIVFIRLIVVAVGTIHAIPAFAFIFELIGLGFSVWFSGRYLVRVSTRTELQDKLTGFRNNFIAPAREER